MGWSVGGRVGGLVGWSVGGRVPGVVEGWSVGWVPGVVVGSLVTPVGLRVGSVPGVGTVVGKLVAGGKVADVSGRSDVGSTIGVVVGRRGVVGRTSVGRRGVVVGRMSVGRISVNWIPVVVGVPTGSTPVPEALVC